MKVAVIQKVSRPSFKRRNQTRWVLYSANGKALCNSGETYANPADCVHGLEVSLGTIVYTDAPSDIADRIFRKVRGLKACHQLGVIHRDDGDVVIYDEVRV